MIKPEAITEYFSEEIGIYIEVKPYKKRIQKRDRLDFKPIIKQISLILIPFVICYINPNLAFAIQGIKTKEKSPTIVNTLSFPLENYSTLNFSPIMLEIIGVFLVKKYLMNSSLFMPETITLNKCIPLPEKNQNVKHLFLNERTVFFIVFTIILNTTLDYFGNKYKNKLSIKGGFMNFLRRNKNTKKENDISAIPIKNSLAIPRNSKFLEGFHSFILKYPIQSIIIILSIILTIVLGIYYRKKIYNGIIDPNMLENFLDFIFNTAPTSHNPEEDMMKRAMNIIRRTIRVPRQTDVFTFSERNHDFTLLK